MTSAPKHLSDKADAAGQVANRLRNAQSELSAALAIATDAGLPVHNLKMNLYSVQVMQAAFASRARQHGAPT